MFHTDITEISSPSFMLRSISLVLLFSLTSFCVVLGNDHPMVGDLPVEELKVYPNPSNTGKYTLSFDFQRAESELTIRVHDLIGNIVYHKQLGGIINSFEVNIDLSMLPKGVYLLVITDGERKQVRRLSYA